uniref:Glycine N-acyltransferase-like protein n=1 Tax=Salvator merianae TaxID=96440 RepID=A0A8D0C1T2_SALMN
MLILFCPSKLRMLEEMLKKSLPQAIQAHGVVMNINRGNPVGHEAVVDSWPQFKALLTRPRKEDASHPSDTWGNMHTAFYKNFDVFRTLLKDTNTINWTNSFLMYGNQNGMYEALAEAAATRKVQLTATPCFSYIHPDPSKIPEHQLDPGFTLSSLNSSHIDQLNKTWLFGGVTEHTRRYLANMVQYFPSACVQDSSGQIVSWSVTHPIGAGGHGYTLPLYRGKHFITIVLRALNMQIHAAGYPVYGCVDLNNVRMQNVMENCGFQRVSELCLLCKFAPA